MRQTNLRCERQSESLRPSSRLKRQRRGWASISFLKMSSARTLTLRTRRLRLAVVTKKREIRQRSALWTKKKEGQPTKLRGEAIQIRVQHECHMLSMVVNLKNQRRMLCEKVKVAFNLLQVEMLKNAWSLKSSVENFTRARIQAVSHRHSKCR